MDADSSWIMRGLDEPVARSAGQFEVNVGTPCILELMKWFGLNTTFFTPGWIAEQYPQMVEAVVKAGHEIGFHGHLHEPPPTLSEAQEYEVVRRGCAALEAVTGKKPIGYRSPIWQLSQNTVRILHEAGFKYTSDFMHTLLPTWNEVNPQLSGRPSRVLMLKEFIDYVKGFEGVWLPRPIDVVEYWRSEHKNFGPRLNSANLQTN
jgi:peptidoglycan/xylan/chitin deacetylase (PgdA/CDA1 family)